MSATIVLLVSPVGSARLAHVPEEPRQRVTVSYGFSHSGVLGLAEGTETAMALHCIAGVPTWATLDADNLRAFPVLPDVRSLIVAVDNDAAGRSAASAVLARYRDAGVAALGLIAEGEGCDLADAGVRVGEFGVARKTNARAPGIAGMECRPSVFLRA